MDFARALYFNGDGSARTFHCSQPTPEHGREHDWHCRIHGQTARKRRSFGLWTGRAPERATHLNDTWTKHALVKPEIYKYKSF